jgi:hypothetical protein
VVLRSEYAEEKASLLARAAVAFAERFGLPDVGDSGHRHESRRVG